MKLTDLGRSSDARSQLQKSASVENHDTRSYGIDALKVLAMLMVVIQHVLGHGGILTAVQPDSVNDYVLWLLEVSALGAVDIFAATTGYLMIEKKFRFSRIISVWLQVIFYTVLITLLFNVIIPESFGVTMLIQSIMPVSFRFYWYFSAYFALCFFMPFINRLLNSLTKRDFTVLILFIVFVLVIINIFDEAFQLEDGYSFAWLAVMYTLGAYAKKYGKSLGSNQALLGIFAVCIIGTWLSRIVIKALTTAIFGRAIGVGFLTSYTSPTYVLSSVALVILFSRVRLPSRWNKIFAFLSPLSFGVYLVHEHDLLRSYLLIGKFASLAEANPLVAILAVLGIAVLIYAVCTLIEYIRTQIFRITKLDAAGKKLGAYLDSKLKLES